MSKNSSHAEERFGPQLDVIPKVSVLMITYNHERFIRDAIASVFMQEVDFPIELVIGEDFSTDATLAYIRQLCLKSPIQVRLITSGRNVGMHANFRRVLGACHGDFISLLEGDDCWLYSRKLSEQVRILESHPELTLCFHRAQRVRPAASQGSGGSEQTLEAVFPEIGSLNPTFEDIADRVWIPTCSAVFRRRRFDGMPDWYFSVPWCDWSTFLLCADSGGVFGLPGVYARYVQHEGGANATLSMRRVNAGALEMFKHLQRMVSPVNRKCCIVMRLKHSYLLAQDAEDQRKYGWCLIYLSRAFWYEVCLRQSVRRPIAWIVRLTFPKAHLFAHKLRSRWK